MQTEPRATEWPTILLFIATYAVWFAGTTVLWPLSPTLAILATAIAIAQLASLTHEVLHGHPFKSQFWSEALVFPATLWKRVAGAAATLSTRVFQALQCGHCPCHFGLAPPHSLQA